MAVFILMLIGAALGWFAVGLGWMQRVFSSVLVLFYGFISFFLPVFMGSGHSGAGPDLVKKSAGHYYDFERKLNRR